MVDITIFELHVENLPSPFEGRSAESSERTEIAIEEGESGGGGGLVGLLVTVATVVAVAAAARRLQERGRERAEGEQTTLSTE